MSAVDPEFAKNWKKLATTHKLYQGPRYYTSAGTPVESEEPLGDFWVERPATEGSWVSLTDGTLTVVERIWKARNSKIYLKLRHFAELVQEEDISYVWGSESPADATTTHGVAVVYLETAPGARRQGLHVLEAERPGQPNSAIKLVAFSKEPLDQAWHKELVSAVQAGTLLIPPDLTDFRVATGNTVYVANWSKRKAWLKWPNAINGTFPSEIPPGDYTFADIPGLTEALTEVFHVRNTANRAECAKSSEDS